MPALANVPAPRTPAPRQFIFRGGNLAALKDHSSSEVLISGPAGTGKSTAALVRLYIACTDANYPGVSCLMLRKTRRSLTDTGLKTFERDILGPGLARFGKVKREQRHAYHFPNGSELVIGGMDDVGKIMSSDWDVIFIQEATECEEDEVEMLTTRINRGRPRYPIQQVIMDCNPSYPTHWLKKRAEAGQTRMYETYHEDNPAMFDWETRAWTADGLKYLAQLDGLTGPRLQRLRYGRWVQAEGVIYEQWSSKHLKDTLPNGKLTPPPGWEVQLWVDFGYSARHPMVVLWATRDPLGNWWVYRELHESGRLVEDVAREARALTIADGLVTERGDVRLSRVICDHDLEDRKTLERHLGTSTTAAVKDVIPGIQAVAKRLLPDAKTGEPSFYVVRDCLVRRDPAIVELKRPTCLAEEMDSYVWSDNEKKDEPVKDMDDSCDAARYGLFFNDRAYARGWRLERI